MELNLKGIVRYDGGRFAGWQVQPDQRTVQGELERCLSQIAGGPVRVHGASRTDAGVHAFGQVFSFRWPAAKGFDRLPRALSSMLGPEIRVVSIEQAADDFHARFSARSKRYAYSICCLRDTDPFTARYAWHIAWEIDWDRLAGLARRLCGRRDFAGFQSAGSPASCTIRTLETVELHRGCVVGPINDKNGWRLEFAGDGFLYHMVRNMTGTLIEIARGRFPESWLEERLDSRGPFKGLTAPPHGLALIAVTY